MAVTGQSAIWRGGAESGVTDKIDFNENSVSTPGGNLMNTSFTITAGIATNSRVGALDKLQDTGAGGVTITLTGTAADPEGTGETVAHKLKAWMLEPKTVASTFPKGRFGLRLNDFSVFDMTPNPNKGYMLESIDFRRDGETKGRVSFVMVLRFNGSEGSADGNGEYKW